MTNEHKLLMAVAGPFANLVSSLAGGEKVEPKDVLSSILKLGANVADSGVLGDVPLGIANGLLGLDKLVHATDSDSERDALMALAEAFALEAERRKFSR